MSTGRGRSRLVPDPGRARAWTLVVDGTPQSHVDLDDPTHLEFEYVRRAAHVADLLKPAGEPLNVLHLGGGAWTLARYVAATRPGSRQRVVEIDPTLVDLVRAELPPPPRSGIRVRVGDARAVLTMLGSGSVDLLVLDVFAGAVTPAHVTTTEFVAEAARVVRGTGVYVANIADGDRLAWARRQVAGVRTAFAHVAVVAEPAVLRGRRFGNLLVLGSQQELPISELARRAAGDPFPARVVADDDVVRFTGGTTAVTDADAIDSPRPPDGLFLAVADDADG